MRNKLLFLGLAAFFLFVTIQRVFAAAIIADIYSAPSEAQRFYGATNASCQRLDTACLDTQYSSVDDIYTVVGDGSTSSAVKIRNASNTQSAYARIVFDVTGVFDGTYYVRIGHSRPVTAHESVICGYLNDTALNQSSCVTSIHSAATVWDEVDIDDIVRRSLARTNRVILRVYVTDSSARYAEVYLKRPLSPADFSIVAQGVSETEANTRVENLWTVFSSAELAVITNGSCIISQIVDINDSPPIYVLLNNSDINVQYDVVDGGSTSYFKVIWDANTSVNGVEEGHNYIVNCTGYLGELKMGGFSQYVYINNQRSILQNILDFYQYILQILGFLGRIEDSVVANLQLGTGMRYTGETSDMVGKLTYAGEIVTTNSTCNATIYYPNMTKWIDNQQMTHLENGIYNYEVTWPYVKGPYTVDGYCYGGNISKETYDTVQIDVLDGVVMRSIT